MRCFSAFVLALGLLFCALSPVSGQSSSLSSSLSIHFAKAPSQNAFPLAQNSHPAAIYLAPRSEATLGAAAEAFAGDLQAVTGTKPQVLHSLEGSLPRMLVVVGVLGESPAIDSLVQSGALDPGAVQAVRGHWESALTTEVAHPFPGVDRALVVAGSDRRGAAFALFTLSRGMGVSPWSWWADVPIAHRGNVFVEARNVLQGEPSVQYRGIFLNDEDWGLRPWASKKMDPAIHNIGPNTYARVFELLLRLHANSLWPAMHAGTMPFNDDSENAALADRWGIVMGSSHSEALLRNNLGEWNEKTDGPWNYQLNAPAMDAYWNKRLATNARYENFYTVGLRGVHDTGLEATGDDQVKARLVERVMDEQRKLLREHIGKPIDRIPQVIWLYKESLELYRAGMRVPDDVTLGWTDDNYGYIRQLPNTDEQKRPGGSGVYYHVSYWGFPHDYLWLCSTPPALIREEMTKAFDHNARRYWVLNVGDLKPAESDIDYFMQLAWDEPEMAKVDQRTFLTHWFAEQFPAVSATKLADIFERYYQLNFVRKPEFMGFNGYNDSINRTSFNPLAWPSDGQPNQNYARLAAWNRLRDEANALAKTLPARDRDAYFELVAYPVEAAAAQDAKFLFTDRSFLDAARHEDAKRVADGQAAQRAYDTIQSLTVQYNGLKGGKWDGMMSAAPRDRQVFRMPATATAGDASRPLPASWGPAQGVPTVSIAAAHYTGKSDGTLAQWKVLPELGISGASVVYGSPGLLANSTTAPGEAWLEYRFETAAKGPATLSIYLLPTFPLDSQHRLSFGLSVDGNVPGILDAGASGEWHEDTAPVWAENVLRNAAVVVQPLGELAPGTHTLRLFYRDPGVVFEHLTVIWPDSAPAYPVPPETRR